MRWRLGHVLTWTSSVSALAPASVPMRTTVVWLRDELRVHDNALFAAASSSQWMVPVFCCAPETYGDPGKIGAKRAKFDLECLHDLQKNLRAARSDLLVLRERPEVAIPRLVADLKTRDPDQTLRVVCAEGVCPEEQHDEARVERALDVPLDRIWEKTLYHHEDVRGLGRCPDDVFTTWRVKVEKAASIRDELSGYRLPAIPPGLGSPPIPTLSDLGGYDESDAVVDGRGDFFAPVGGEAAGLARLQRYIFDEDRLKDYFDTRNQLRGQGFSTKLSPWLARGCVSPRRVFYECKRYERDRIKNKSTYWVVFELTWRDYFIFYARKYGRRLFWPSGTKGLGSPSSWRGVESPEFQAWVRGETGVPLVDANIKELLATGFMSNRGRQNVASFLIHDLNVDWRAGAAFFERHLVDYTPEANWGNWHHAAGLNGGRLNRFNILKQSKDYDQSGSYVKLWLPQLEKVPAPACFEPWLLNRSDQQRYDCVIGHAYPRRLASSSYTAANSSSKKRSGIAKKKQKNTLDSWLSTTG